MSKRQHPHPSFAGYEIDSEYGFVTVEVSHPGISLIMKGKHNGYTYYSTSIKHNGINIAIFPRIKPGLYSINQIYSNESLREHTSWFQALSDTWTQAYYVL